MRILGLDASTSTVGLAIIDYEDGYAPTLVHCEFYKPDKTNGIIDMLVTTRAYILNIIKKYSIDEFAIEDYARFMAGKSSAGTIIPLAILNTTLRLSILDAFNAQVQAINVLAIRHALKLTKKLPKKEEMPELVAKHLGIKFPYIYKYNKRKKQDIQIVENEDVADAIAVALGKIFIDRKLKLKSSKAKTKRSKKV